MYEQSGSASLPRSFLERADDEFENTPEVILGVERDSKFASAATHTDNPNVRLKLPTKLLLCASHARRWSRAGTSLRGRGACVSVVARASLNVSHG